MKRLALLTVIALAIAACGGTATDEAAVAPELELTADVEATTIPDATQTARVAEDLATSTAIAPAALVAIAETQGLTCEPSPPTGRDGPGWQCNDADYNKQLGIWTMKDDPEKVREFMVTSFTPEGDEDAMNAGALALFEEFAALSGGDDLVVWLTANVGLDTTTEPGATDAETTIGGVTYRTSVLDTPDGPARTFVGRYGE